MPQEMYNTARKAEQPLLPGSYRCQDTHSITTKPPGGTRSWDELGGRNTVHPIAGHRSWASGGWAAAGRREEMLLSLSTFGAQNLTPEDLTEVVVTHLRTEDDPPPEPHNFPLPEEKPPTYTPPPIPQLPPPKLLPPPQMPPPPIPPPMPLPPPNPPPIPQLPPANPPPMPLPPNPPPMPPLPPEIVVLPTTAGREAQVTHLLPKRTSSTTSEGPRG